MAETRLVILLLALITVCLIVLTVSLLTLIAEFRGIAKRIHQVLPEAERMMRDARDSLHKTKKLVTRVDETARAVDGIVRQACVSAADALDRIASIKAKAESFFTGHSGNGNGTRAEPRRRHTS